MPFLGLLLLPMLATAPNLVTDAAKGAALLRGCQAEVRLMESSRDPNIVDTADLVDGSYCVGYLNGFLTGVDPRSRCMCLPENTIADLVRAYVHYMERNPQLNDQDKRIGLRLALQDAFPCPAAPQSSLS